MKKLMLLFVVMITITSCGIDNLTKENFENRMIDKYGEFSFELDSLYFVETKIIGSDIIDIYHCDFKIKDVSQVLYIAKSQEGEFLCFESMRNLTNTFKYSKSKFVFFLKLHPMKSIISVFVFMLILALIKIFIVMCD